MSPLHPFDQNVASLSQPPSNLTHARTRQSKTARPPPPNRALAGIAGLVVLAVQPLAHGLRARRHRPEGAVQRVGVRRAGRAGRHAARAQPLARGRVPVVAAPLARQRGRPAHRAEVRRAQRYRGQAPPRRELPGGGRGYHRGKPAKGTTYCM